MNAGTNRWYEPLARTAAGLRVTGCLLEKETPVILVPHLFSGLGDWVLINQLIRRYAADLPGMPLVVAIPEALGFATFYRDVALLNPDITAIVEIPFGMDRYFGAYKMLDMKNEFGLNPLVWAEALVLLFLRRLRVGCMYKYAYFPLLFNHENGIVGDRRCEYVHELNRLLQREGDVPGLHPHAGEIPAAEELMHNWKIGNDERLVLLHAKFEDDFQAFLRALEPIALTRPIKVVNIGKERHTYDARSWLHDAAAEDIPLPVLAGVMHKADLFVGNISGPMHLAAAVKTPVVALYFREYTGIDWHPKMRPDQYVMLYKKAYNVDGCEIVDPLQYGYKNEHVARFEPVPDEEIRTAIERMLVL